MTIFVKADDETALMALSLMQPGHVVAVAVDIDIALSAATKGLPLADRLIYATAQAHGAVL